MTITAGDHICGLYTGLQERDEVLLPYLRRGLLAGDKCICVVDATEPEVVLGRIGEGIDARACADSHQLDLVRASDTYLRSGQFSTPEMIGFWKAAISAVMNGGRFDLVRAVGEMTWSLRDVPGVEDVIGFEAELNRLLPLFPQVILCLYDLERFGGGMLVDLLSTHPKLLLGGIIMENPYYLSPDEFLAERREADHVSEAG
jgi:hypothetical protein